MIYGYTGNIIASRDRMMYAFGDTMAIKTGKYDLDIDHDVKRCHNADITSQPPSLMPIIHTAGGRSTFA